MTFVQMDAVTIRWRSDRALAESVRDANGIHDVTWSALTNGWSCSCPEPYGCAHILAVRAIGSVAS